MVFPFEIFAFVKMKLRQFCNQLIRISNSFIEKFRYSVLINSRADKITLQKLNTLISKYFLLKTGSLENIIQDIDDFETNNRKELEKEDNEKSSSQALIKYIYNGIGSKGLLAMLILCIVTQMTINISEIWVAIW